LPSERLLRRLGDILDNIGRIERVTSGLDFRAFTENEQAIFAVLHALLIISEAARRLGNQAEKAAADQPWQAIRALGNVLRHQYDDVDPAAIWRIGRDGLPSLKQAIERALARFRSADRPREAAGILIPARW
jgi:uncharacterized protein with HEPN domain